MNQEPRHKERKNVNKIVDITTARWWERGSNNEIIRSLHTTRNRENKEKLCHNRYQVIVVAKKNSLFDNVQCFE